MAVFPKIQSPCPYKSQLASVMDGDMCRMCQRQVFDLTNLSDEARLAFLNGCAQEVCVSYRLPARLAAAAVAVATLAAPMAAAADPLYCPDAIEIVVGGITDLANIEYIEDPADAALPELAVVYEDETQAPIAKAAGETQVGDAKTVTAGASS